MNNCNNNIFSKLTELKTLDLPIGIAHTLTNFRGEGRGAGLSPQTQRFWTCVFTRKRIPRRIFVNTICTANLQLLKWQTWCVKQQKCVLNMILIRFLCFRKIIRICFDFIFWKLIENIFVFRLNWRKREKRFESLSYKRMQGKQIYI